jgi:hypothetical protein
MQGVLAVDFFSRDKSRMFATQRCFLFGRSWRERNRRDRILSEIFVTILLFS